MNKLLLSLVAGAFMASAQATNEIKSGEKWYDTNGSFINAHGGQVVYAEGYYYWFGETRATSVSCYRSADLMNWTHLSDALSPTGTATDDNKDIAKGRNIERPKVAFCEATGKWVMWAHWEDGTSYSAARVLVAQSDKVEGPYKLVDVFRPNEHDSRDQTLFVDYDSKAYHFCSTDMNTNMNIALLNDDYLTPSATETKVLKSQKYEAPAIFRVGDIYFGLFSGCTSWTPNPSRYAWAMDILGTWHYGTDFTASDGSHGSHFCVDDGRETTYKSQSTYVIKVEGREKAYIYMGDRWNSGNVASSTYVWLPLSVRSGYPTVRWYDSWDMSVFDEMYRYKRIAVIEDGQELMLLEKRSNRVVSRPKSSFVISDDDPETNCHFVVHTTPDRFVVCLEDAAYGKFLESVYGSMRLNTENGKLSQQWQLVMEDDGYFHLKNASDGKCLTLSGSSTYDGTTVFLSDEQEGSPQSFAFYYDSKSHPDYPEADIFSKAYRDSIASEIQIQTSIRTVTNNDNDSRGMGIYDLKGCRLSNSDASLSTLPKGIYIVNGKKVVN